MNPPLTLLEALYGLSLFVGIILSYHAMKQSRDDTQVRLRKALEVRLTCRIQELEDRMVALERK